METILDSLAFPFMGSTDEDSSTSGEQTYNYTCHAPWVDRNGDKMSTPVFILDEFSLKLMRDGEKKIINGIQSRHTAILYFHGNGTCANDSSMLFLLRLIHQRMGIPIMTFDYPGRGAAVECERNGSLNVDTIPVAEKLLRAARGLSDNQILPTVDRATRATEAVMEFIIKQFPRIKQIIIWGRSIGTYFAIHAASKYTQHGKIHSLILESPLASAEFDYVRYSVFGWLDSATIVRKFVKLYNEHSDKEDETANMVSDTLSTTKWPKTLIIHGTSDDVVHHRNSLKLKQIIPRSQIYLVEGGDHYGIEVDVLTHAFTNFYT